MADAADHISKTLHDLKQDLFAKLSDIKRLLLTINALEDFGKVPQTRINEVWGTLPVEDGQGGASSAGSSGGGQAPIRPDEYLGEAPLKAAKKYILRVRHAVHIDEIAAAIKTGGAAIQGSKWKEELETSLIRSTADVVKVGDGTFGLTTFYTADQLKGLRSTRPQSNGGRRAPKRAKKRRTAKGHQEKHSGGSGNPEPPE